MAVTEIFHALGDTTRLKIVDKLSNGNGFYTITKLTEDLEITRQGARKHLKVLVDAKVVNLEQQGRSTFVHLDKKTLAYSRSYIADLERHWDERLEALRQFVEAR